MHAIVQAASAKARICLLVQMKFLAMGFSLVSGLARKRTQFCRYLKGGGVILAGQDATDVNRG